MHRFPVRHQQFLHKLVFLMNHQSREKINLKTLSEPHGSWIYYVIIIFILFLIPCANKTWSAHDNLFWHICCNYTITTGLSNSHAMFKGFFTYSHVSFYTEEDSPQYGTQTSESPEEFWRNTYCWAPPRSPGEPEHLHCPPVSRCLMLPLQGPHLGTTEFYISREPRITDSTQLMSTCKTQPILKKYVRLLTRSWQLILTA